MKWSLMSAVAILLVAGVTAAQSPRMLDENGLAGKGILEAQQVGQIMARDLLGSAVVTQDGRRIGDVADLVLDPQGRVAGVVIGAGGFLGIGRRTVGVTSAHVRIEPTAGMGGDHIVLVRLTRDEIAEVPQFRTLADMQNRSPSR